MVTVIRSTEATFGGVLDLVEDLLAEVSERRFPGLDRSRLVAELLPSALFTAFLAIDEDKPVGVVTLSEAVAAYAAGRYGIISELYVVPAYRSMGVGTQLLDAVKAEARSRGWRYLEVTAPTSPKGDRPVGFYERSGFMFAGPKLGLWIVKPVASAVL